MRGSFQWHAAVLGVLMSAAPAPAASDLFLRWTASPIARGYRVYVGAASRTYDAQYDVGLLREDTLESIVHFLLRGLHAGQEIFVAVTAYNEAGESAYSNERFIYVDASAPGYLDAGLDQLLAAGTPAMLAARTNDDLSFFWFQSAGRPGLLTSRRGSRTTFTLTRAGAAEITLVGYDTDGLAVLDTVVVLAVDPPPSAAPTATRASSTSTPQPTPTVTSTPTEASTALCAGAPPAPDTVTIAALLTSVNIALGAAPTASCPGADLNTDGAVTVDELVTLVDAALDPAPTE